MYTTNGYLIRQIREAKDAPDHQDQVRADAYFRRFRALEDLFLRDIHSFVDAGLFGDSVANAEDGANPDIMTIHGCRHISDVIDSLDRIATSIDLRRGATKLSAEEAYILLCAAHVHDVGNIGGRQGHPQRAGHLIEGHRDLFYDTVARENIFDVARVHGGHSERFGRDVFREIGRDNFEFPRLHLLASMLRIADELSESPERVPDALLNWYQASPASNLAYRYAQAFRGFDLQNDTLNIRMRLYPEQHQYTAEINGHLLTFFDHLEQKIDRLEREVRYCSQYGRPDFDVRNIRITIEYFEHPLPAPMTNSAMLTLELGHGYPEGRLTPLGKRCAELQGTITLASYVRGE